MELLFTDRRHAIAAGVVPGIGPAEVTALFERRVALDGMPVLLDEAMRPVEPLSSWFRHLAVMGRSPEAMHKYAYFNDPMREVDEAFRARTTTTSSPTPRLATSSSPERSETAMPRKGDCRRIPHSPGPATAAGTHRHPSRGLRWSFLPRAKTESPPSAACL